VSSGVCGWTNRTQDIVPPAVAADTQRRYAFDNPGELLLADHATLQLPGTTQRAAAIKQSIARWVSPGWRSYLLIVLLLMAGLTWRIWWVGRHFKTNIGGEAGNAAVAFAQTGVVADAFFPGEGPTAHLSPIAPIINGWFLRIFGVETVQSTWALTFFALACCLGAAIILNRAFAIMGASPVSRLAAFAFACLLPLNAYTETDEFRFWEGGMAALLSAFILWLTVRADRKDSVGFLHLAALSLLLALLFFLSPPVGLAGYANLALLLLRRVPIRRWAATIATSALILAAVLTPWTIRNYAVFGRFIPLRGNAGLELAQANHPAAVSGIDQKAVFRARQAEIHPDGEPAVIRKMQAEGGEVPYSERLGKEAMAWIKQHPADFARLSLRHARQFFFPPRWLWTVYGERERGVDIKLAITWITALLGLLGAAACLFWWRGRMLYAVAIIVLPALPYMVVQPVLRYRYIVLFPLFYLGTELVCRLWERLTARRSAKGVAA
jgi:hypothetical protein